MYNIQMKEVVESNNVNLQQTIFILFPFFPQLVKQICCPHKLAKIVCSQLKEFGYFGFI